MREGIAYGLNRHIRRAERLTFHDRRLSYANNKDWSHQGYLFLHHARFDIMTTHPAKKEMRSGSVLAY